MSRHGSFDSRIAREPVSVGRFPRTQLPRCQPYHTGAHRETAQRLVSPNQMVRNLSFKHNHNIALVLSGFGIRAYQHFDAAD
ncbi:MAG: hypothetical protein ACLT0Z_11055 [Gemmiger sp.]